MNQTGQDAYTVVATAQEVMPRFGLAFVTDSKDTVWGLTQSMQGPGLAALAPGRKLRLNVRKHAGFSIVESYQPAD